jgi:hypothetical protein
VGKTEDLQNAEMASNIMSQIKLKIKFFYKKVLDFEQKIEKPFIKQPFFLDFLEERF